MLRQSCHAKTKGRQRSFERGTLLHNAIKLAANTFGYCEKAYLRAKAGEYDPRAVSTLDHTRQPINQEGANFFLGPLQTNARSRRRVFDFITL